MKDRMLKYSLYILHGGHYHIYLIVENMNHAHTYHLNGKQDRMLKTSPAWHSTNDCELFLITKT